MIEMNVRDNGCVDQESLIRKISPSTVGKVFL